MMSCIFFFSILLSSFQFTKKESQNNTIFFHISNHFIPSIYLANMLLFFYCFSIIQEHFKSSSRPYRIKNRNVIFKHQHMFPRSCFFGLYLMLTDLVLFFSLYSMELLLAELYTFNWTHVLTLLLHYYCYYSLHCSCLVKYKILISNRNFIFRT